MGEGFTAAGATLIGAIGITGAGLSICGLGARCSGTAGIAVGTDRGGRAGVEREGLEEDPAVPPTSLGGKGVSFAAVTVFPLTLLEVVFHPLLWALVEEPD